MGVALGTTFLDLLAAKVALELRVLTPEQARGCLAQLDRAYPPGGLVTLLQQHGTPPDVAQRVAACAQRAYYLKSEHTYMRVLQTQQPLPEAQLRDVRARSDREGKRVGQLLVEAGLLTRPRDEQLCALTKQTLDPEEAAAVQSLRVQHYQGIEQPSRMITTVVAQVPASFAPAEGTQILPQDVASGKAPANQLQLGSSGAGGPRPGTATAPGENPELWTSAMDTAEFAAPATFPPELAGTGLEEKYRVERKLGEGGMGAVYLAYALEDEAKEQPMALKVVRPGVVNPDRFREAASRFKREILATSFCAHENVIEIFDASETQDGSYYMAMEYIEGEQLDELIKREGPLPLDRLVDLLDDALSALSAIHAANIVHRDIKPQNFRIWRDERGRERLTIMDFGIARVLDAEDSGQGEQFFRTMGGRITGSPAYLSPESITDPDKVDQRSDLYSLGISIFRIAAGRLPFLAKEPTEYLPLHLYKKPPALGEAVPGTPPELERLYEMLLEKISTKRVQSADEALAFLRQQVRPALGLPPRGQAPVAAPAVGEVTPLPPMPELPAVPALPETPPLPALPKPESADDDEDAPRKGRSSDRLIARPKDLQPKGGGSKTGLKVAVALGGVLLLVGVVLIALAATDTAYIPFLSDLFHGE